MPPSKPRSTTNPSGRAEGGLLQEQAYTSIKNRLITGELKGGVVLSERQVAEELGMSKTPIKAAFTRLDQEGYLKISPQHGVVVHEFTVDEIRQHMDLRMALEAFTVRSLAVNGLTDAQLAKIEENLSEQRDVNQEDAISEVIRTDVAFHLLLCQFIENPEMLKILSQLIEKQHRAISTVLSTNAPRRSASLEEHRAITAAIQDRRGHLASEMMIAHLDRGKQFFMGLH